MEHLLVSKNIAYLNMNDNLSASRNTGTRILNMHNNPERLHEIHADKTGDIV